MGQTVMEMETIHSCSTDSHIPKRKSRHAFFFSKIEDPYGILSRRKRPDQSKRSRGTGARQLIACTPFPVLIYCDQVLIL